MRSALVRLATGVCAALCWLSVLSLVSSPALASSRFWQASGNPIKPSKNFLSVSAGANTPITCLGAKLFAWYDAQDAASITQSSGAVSQWTDKSGNGNNATQGTAGNKPSYSATGWNGTKPGITFDGTNDYLTTATTIPYNGATGVAIWVAARSTGTAARAMIGGQGSDIELRYNSGSLDVLKTTSANLQSAAVANGYHVVGTELSTNSTALSIDGTRTTGVTNPAIIDGVTFIGTNNAGTSEQFDSVIGEVVLATGILTSGERSCLNSYMAVGTGRW